ncbi:MAG: hypothetical protein JWN98_986 [Abditibacteriota bacterium]|nr:hypothetical protein [Abditibacteriota bacterium]
MTEDHLQAAQKYFAGQEALRQSRLRPEQSTLVVARPANAPTVDGKLDEWDAKSFVSIEAKVSAAVAMAGDLLFAAWKTDDRSLLRNQPESLAHLFKSGGALDLMIGNVEGGQRLLVTRVGEKTTAVLYRPRDASAGGEPVKFISNLGINKTVSIDRVQNVSEQVQLAQEGTQYELSIPLALLNWAASTGQTLKGDIGILRGNGVQTLQRIYWHNKAAGLVSDMATEAELTPQLWGRWELAKR